MRTYLILIPLISLCLLSVSCQSDTSARSSRENAAKKVKQVKVTRAQEGKLARTVGVSGTLAAEEEVVLSLKVTGRVRDIMVDLGSKVRKGQPLIRLEPTDFELRVQQADAALEQARARLGLQEDQDAPSTVDPEGTGVVKQAAAVLEEARLTQRRMEELWNQGLVPHSQYDDAVAAFRVAEARYQDALEEVRNRQALLYQREAELQIARKQFSDSILTSPIDGAVQVRHVSPGQYLATGDPALTIVRVHPLRLKLAIPEREAAYVKKGQTVQVRVEGDQNAYYGKVARLSPAITTNNRTLMIEAEIPNENGLLRPGSFAKAEIVVAAEQPAVLVPKSSIVTFAGVDKVIAVENNETVEKRVRTGRKTQDQVEILEGLKAGETIVIHPGNLVGGEPVKAY
ncbi:MAG TPA: efflux RND transporter periplasmic adaptor subunit [Acidobacteriota bacterium]|nr:efflux RND transporter periplasmic adaptor subunit [Acidobacteriota bacterium]